MKELIEQIKQWGADKGITGPNGKGTLLGQLSKTQEELTETRDAAVEWGMNDFDEIGHDIAMGELKDGIGDTTITLILAAEMSGLDFEDCVQAAYNEIKERTGSMVNGIFVKNAKSAGTDASGKKL
jgi:NTP pyrophosphatase (non-canonical NTP hydrolase)